VAGLQNKKARQAKRQMWQATGHYSGQQADEAGNTNTTDIVKQPKQEDMADKRWILKMKRQISWKQDR
jgi:hypothetical protein